jgi:membrane protein involved in colicin uptake
MAGGYFGDKYFPDGFFPQGYFGTEGEADPNAMRGTAAGIATVTGLLTYEGQETEVVGGAQFGPIHRLRRKKKTKVEKKRTLKDAIDDAFEELETIAIRAQAATEAQARQAVDSEALIQAVGDAAYKAAYEAAMAKAIAEEQAEAQRQAETLAKAKTALEAAFAKAEQDRRAKEAAAIADAMLQVFAKAKADADAAYQRFIELEAQNDDDEEAAVAMLIALEAA